MAGIDRWERSVLAKLDTLDARRGQRGPTKILADWVLAIGFDVVADPNDSGRLLIVLPGRPGRKRRRSGEQSRVVGEILGKPGNAEIV